MSPSGSSQECIIPHIFSPTDCQSGRGSIPLETNQLPSGYRTRMCYRVAHGSFCHYAETCTFAHSLDEMRHFQKMYFEQHSMRNPLFRTRPCFDFARTGFCARGELCAFFHSEKIKAPLRRMKKQKQVLELRPKKQRPCWGFIPGVGDGCCHAKEWSCEYLHPGESGFDEALLAKLSSPIFASKSPALTINGETDSIPSDVENDIWKNQLQMKTLEPRVLSTKAFLCPVLFQSGHCSRALIDCCYAHSLDEMLQHFDGVFRAPMATSAF